MLWVSHLAPMSFVVRNKILVRNEVEVYLTKIEDSRKRFALRLRNRVLFFETINLLACSCVPPASLAPAQSLDNVGLGMVSAGLLVPTPSIS